uniref:PX domain-containing protein n=1 Tax=Globodera rostochiensis TaxID=31243 RepID=A0A914H9C1_GLORO
MTSKTAVNRRICYFLAAEENLLRRFASVGIFVRNHGWLRKEVEFVPQEEVVTRWLSKLKMISSVLRIIQKLNELKNTEHRTKMTQEFLENLRTITKNLEELQNIQKVLTIFYECVLFFQQEHQPTIHLVWPKIFEIQKRNFIGHCAFSSKMFATKNRRRAAAEWSLRSGKIYYPCFYAPIDAAEKKALFVLRSSNSLKMIF